MLARSTHAVSFLRRAEEQQHILQQSGFLTQAKDECDVNKRCTSPGKPVCCKGDGFPSACRAKCNSSNKPYPEGGQGDYQAEAPESLKPPPSENASPKKENESPKKEESVNQESPKKEAPEQEAPKKKEEEGGPEQEAPKQEAPKNVKTWAVLSKPKPEETKKVGMEFELNWITGQFKTKIADGITQKWGSKTGHLAFYTCAGDWKNWEVHLDGSIWPEMVLNEVSKDQLKIELRRFKTAFGPIVKSSQWKQFLTEREANNEFVRQPGFPNAVYEHLKKFVVLPGAADRPAGSPQVTSTYTLDEMKAGTNMAHVVSSGFKQQTTDKDVRDKVLYAAPYKENAKFEESILIKTLAEQMGEKDSDNINIENPPKPKDFPDEGIDKVKEEYHLHTKANKVINMFTRGGKPAYLVEIRKSEGYQAWFDSLREWTKQAAGPAADAALNQIANKAFS